MQRMFVALRPPRAVRDALAATMGGVTGARWQDDDQFHLTLRFLGDLDRHAVEDVAAALAGVAGPAPVLGIAGAGTFGSGGRPHTLWAGIAPNPALTDLRRRVDRALRLAGVSLDTRAFAPHVTLARLNRATGPLDAWLARHAGLALPPATHAGLHLYESDLRREGAFYSLVAFYPLA